MMLLAAALILGKHMKELANSAYLNIWSSDVHVLRHMIPCVDCLDQPAVTHMALTFCTAPAGNKAGLHTQLPPFWLPAVAVRAIHRIAGLIRKDGQQPA